MLDYIEYSKVNNSKRISKLKEEIERLKTIGAVSNDVMQYLQSVEICEKCETVKAVHENKNGGCLIEINQEYSLQENVLFEALKNIWNKQSEKTKNEVSIMFSGNMDDIRTVSVYWRRGTGFSTNDIADIVEGGLFM
jgi:hypothetical protein